MKRRRLGRVGETKAARYLRRRGLKIIERNWRCRQGELDIVARHGDTCVIVEVRSGQTRFAGRPELTVGPRKQQKIALLARLWLAQSDWKPGALRFDVVGLVRRGALRWDIRWYPNAFGG